MTTPEHPHQPHSSHRREKHNDQSSPETADKAHYDALLRRARIHPPALSARINAHIDRQYAINAVLSSQALDQEGSVQYAVMESEDGQPVLTLSGKWLLDAGLTPETPLLVRVMKECLVISIDDYQGDE